MVICQTVGKPRQGVVNMATQREHYEKLAALIAEADKAWVTAKQYAQDNGLTFEITQYLPSQDAAVQEEDWHKSSEHWSYEADWASSSC